MVNVLNVAAIVPTEIPACLCATNCNSHGLNPHGILDFSKATIQSILHILKNITSFKRITYGTDRIFDVPQLGACFAMTRRNRKSMARHFRWFGKSTNKFNCLLNCKGNRIVHGINIPQIQKKVNKKKSHPREGVG